MKGNLGRNDYLSPRRLGVLLLVLFGLTILSFLASTLLSETRSRGIDAAANSIVTNAAPSIDRISSARTDLRRFELALDDFTDAAAAGQRSSTLEADMRHARATFEADWTAYTQLPMYPGEPALWSAIGATRDQLDSTVDEVVRRLDAGDTTGAERELNARAKSIFDQMDLELHRLVEFNAKNATELGSRIEMLRGSSRSLIALLDPLSAFFALVAAFLVATVVRRYARLMELRVAELEHFAGRVAHDIRSPLTSVGLTLDLARRKPDIDERTRANLDRGTRTLQRIGQLVDGLLVFARAGAPPTEGAQADVRDVLRGVVEEMRPVAEEKGIKLQVDDSGTSSVAASPGVLASLISNLVGNAVKYMGDAPERRVTIRAHDVGSWMRLEVEDTGPGVPRELGDKIFTPYVRGAESTIPGLGLGLATVRRLAQAHGGAAGVRFPSVGSLFWFELPKVSVTEPQRTRGLFALRSRRAT